MFLLAGYAGSGKTTVLAGICDAAEKMGRHCYLMALSGRAAQRMSEATGRAATTIARFLSRRVGKVQPGLGAHEIVVIDEASMLDLPTLWRILRRIGRASLVLVGDPAQLPPIGFGLTFHSLLQCSALPSVTLDRVLRQRVGTGIPMIAEAARHGTLPNLPPFDAAQPGVFFVDAKPGDAIAALLQTGRQMGATGATPDDMQIISPVRRGPAGIDAINQHLHGLRCAAGGHTHEEVLNLGLCPDDPIIWTKNDPVRNLTNGSMGRVLSVFQSGLVARLDEQEITLQERDLKNVALAYAITVHKAQGSQWPKVLVPVFRSPLLDRTLLYTAITRASEQVVLVGDRQAAMEAILATPKSLTRDTSLPGRLERSRSSMEHSAQV